MIKTTIRAAFLAVLGLVSVGTLLWPSNSIAAESALFSHGEEKFRVVNEAGQTLTRTILDDSPTKKFLAAAIVTSLNAAPQVQPKLVFKDGIVVDLEQITLIPLKGDELEVDALVAGHELEMPVRISKAQFLEGKAMTLKFKPIKKQISQFSMNFSGGQFTIQLQKNKSELLLQNGRGTVEVSMPLAGTESESVQFSGKGIRTLPKETSTKSATTSSVLEKNGQQ